MKKIITALNNPIVNFELQKQNKYKIVGNDICYQEGIFEMIEKENIDIIILSEILPGNLDIKELILKIKEINSDLEIIIILEQENQELVKFLKLNNINNIFYNNKINIKEFIDNICEKNEIFDVEKVLKNKTKIISIIGPSGSGKTVFTSVLAKTISDDKKVLVLDFDLLNNDVNLILNKNKKINIILGQDIMFKNDEFIKIEDIIEEYKNDYDVILINTSSECYFKINRRLIILSDISLFITGTDLLEIKKSKTLLNIYVKEWGIEPQKINIIFNKYNTYSIDEKILLNVFKKYKVLGKIKYTGNYKLELNKKLLQNINI